MLKTDGLPPSKFSRPSSRMRSVGTAGARPASKKCLICDGLEAVDAGGHGRVRREDGGRASGSEGLVPAEGHAGIGHGSWMRSMPRKPAWPSLVWKTSGAGVPVSLLVDAEGLDAAHAQEQFLLQTVVAAAAVQAVRDAAGGFIVGRNVGVQQQQRNASDVGTPDVRVAARGRWAAAGRSGRACRAAVLGRGARRSVRGSPSGSSTGYVSCCQASRDRDCLK